MIHIPSSPKILITRTDNLGDVILTLPVITALKKYIPDSEITFLIKKYTAEAVDNYPGISNIVHIDEFNTLSKLTNLFKEIKFDISLNVYPRYNIALAGLFANIPVRIGTAYRWYSFLFNEKLKVHRKDGKRHESDYNLDLARALFPDKEIRTEINFRTDQKIFEELKQKLQSKYNFSFDSPFIIVHPFSKGSAKKWNSDNFQKFISEFLKLEQGYTLFITGDASEKQLINALCAKVENNSSIINIAGELSMKELIELINMSRLFISNSTGPLHIAGALNKKTISFFPRVIPTNSERWKPLGNNNFIFESDKDDPNSKFIEGIEIEDVVAKSIEMIKT